MTDYASNLPVRGSAVDGGAIDATLTHHIVMGSDGVNYRILKTDANGNQYSFITDGTNVASVQAGTNKALRVAVSDGTDDLDVLVVDSAYGATPTALPVVGKYEATPTVYADGDAVPFLTDSSGRLITVSASSDLSVVETYTSGSATLTAGGELTQLVNYSPAADSYIDQVHVSGSGLMRIELYHGTTSSETLFMVAYNSTANPNWDITFKVSRDTSSTQSFKVKAINLEPGSAPAKNFTGYATIIAHA